MAFLPPPSNLTQEFVQPRETLPSAAGTEYERYSGAPQWRGTIAYPAQRNPAALQALLAGADGPGKFFFADLRKPGVDITGVTPVWRDAISPLRDRITISTAGGVVAPEDGDIVAIRASARSDYPTARYIRDVLVLPGNTAELHFNAPIPTEFFTDAFGSRIQWNTNRPYIRAVFVRDPLRSRIGTNKVSALQTLQWREDTSATISELTNLRDIADTTEPQVLELETGGTIDFESGAAIELE